MNDQPVEIRSSTVAGVSFPKRLIELIVCPYEVETLVEHRHRTIGEIISRGAFNGINEMRNRIVKANRDHDLGRIVGRAVSFDPTPSEGLIAEVKVSKTDLGEETLTLADDGLLAASAGFTLLFDKAAGKVKEAAEVWETRNRRRLNHLWLHHVAFVPEPAYEGAQVLSVRKAPAAPIDPVARPNLAQLEAERLAAQYAAIDRRYSLDQH